MCDKGLLENSNCLAVLLRSLYSLWNNEFISLLLSTEIGSAKSPKEVVINPSQKKPSALFFYSLASFDIFQHSYCFQILTWLTTIGSSLPGFSCFLLFSECLCLCWILVFPEYKHFFLLHLHACAVHGYILY